MKEFSGLRWQLLPWGCRWCLGIAFLALASIEALAEPYKLELTTRNVLQLDAHGVSPIHRQGSARLDEHLTGSEHSECRPYGRKSTAIGTADVQNVERRSDGIAFDLLANSASFGGHYRDCVTCVQQNCVGIHGNDTRANSKAGSTAVVVVRFDAEMPSSIYIVEVGVASQGRTPTIVLTDATGRPLNTSTSTGASYEIHGDPGSIYYLTTSVDAATSNAGGCCDDKSNSAARVDVRLRKAPLLASKGGYEPFIKGGSETAAYANVGAILIDGQLHCSGTVIGSRTVLTAAHCLQGYENQFEKFSFLVGSNLLQPTFGPVKVAEFAYPNDVSQGFMFNPKTLEDDIAVIYLAAPSGIQPAKLHAGAPPWADIERKISLVFVGYGFDVIENQKVGAGIKREAAWMVDNVENRRVRFKVPGKNTCKGDSGGPAFLISNGSITQVAVTSGGSSDCSTGFETRVDAFLSWLQGRIK